MTQLKSEDADSMPASKETSVEERDQRNGAQNKTGRSRSFAEFASEYGVVIFLILISVFFSLALPETFPTWDNIRSILSDNAIVGLLAIAVVLPLAAGEFDLSVAATLGFSAILTAYLTSKGMAVPLAVAIVLAGGFLIGALNAFLVVRIGVNAFIATLGVATLLAGGNLLVTNGATISDGIPTGLTDISQTKIGGLAFTVLYLLVIATLIWYLLDFTPFGRYLRATGMGRSAARLTGIRTDRYLALAFIIAGGIAAFCGVLHVGRIGSAAPSVGPEFLLPAYAAAFLGTTTIQRGRFNVWGTIVGVLVLAVGISGLTLWGAPFWLPNIFNGAALILAVSVAVLLGKRRDRYS